MGKQAAFRQLLQIPQAAASIANRPSLAGSESELLSDLELFSHLSGSATKKIGKNGLLTSQILQAQEVTNVPPATCELTHSRPVRNPRLATEALWIFKFERSTCRERQDLAPTRDTVDGRNPAPL